MENVKYTCTIKRKTITAFYLHPVDLSSSDTLHVASLVSNKFLRR